MIVRRGVLFEFAHFDGSLQDLADTVCPAILERSDRCIDVGWREGYQ
jgi:hypothetical protein